MSSASAMTILSLDWSFQFCILKINQKSYNLDNFRYVMHFVDVDLLVKNLKPLHVPGGYIDDNYSLVNGING